MLIYEFPPKLNRMERQAKALHDLEEHRKIKKNMLKNLILGTIIIALSFFTDILLIKAVLIIIGVLNIAVGVILYSISSYDSDNKIYSRIYDDHLEHCQKIYLTNKYLCGVIFYNEVSHSEQDTKGNMIFYMKNFDKSELWAEDRNGLKSEYKLRDGTIKMHFADVKAKLTLVNDLYEKISYPKKEYNVIDDETDDYYSEEDLKWDKLHKHGL